MNTFISPTSGSITHALQSEIDDLHSKGGGRITIPAGNYVIGTVELKSHINLHLEPGARLSGSLDINDYPCIKSPIAFHEDKEGLRSLIFAYNAENISITGQGCIDGRGPESMNNNNWDGIRAGRPRNIWFGKCHNVLVEGICLRNSGFWMQHYIACRGLKIHGLDVYNHGSCNNDGLDIDGCEDVLVSDCRIDAHDDAICLKSGNKYTCQNVVITNCITATHCNHIKTGTESNGGFRNIRISNIQMIPSSVTTSDKNTMGADWRGAGGIMLGCVDGGALENISISNIQMSETRVPLCIQHGDRGRPISGTDVRQPPQYMRSITISHLTATQAGSCGCHITGLDEIPIEHIALDNITMTFEGNPALKTPPTALPENRNDYPSSDAYGAYLPAYGLYCRNVERMQLSNICFKLNRHDPRPALGYAKSKDIHITNLQAD